jgi:phosphohistidine swiveling domain-containing protein
MRTLNKNNYVYMGRWKGPTLAWSPWFNWGEGETLKKLGVDAIGDVVTLDGHGFFDVEGSKIIKDLSQEKLTSNDHQFFINYIELSEKKLHEFTELIERLNNFKNEDPIALFEEFFSRYHQLTGPWAGVFYIGDVGQDFLTKVAEKHGYAVEQLSGYMHPDRRTYSMDHKHEILSLQKELGVEGFKSINVEDLPKIQKTNPELYVKIQNLVHKYAWVGTHHFWGTPYTEYRLIEDLNTTKEERISKSEIKSGPDLDIALEVARMLAWLRLQTAETVNIVSYAARPLFTFLAEKIGITYDDVIWLSHQEIISFAQSNSHADKDEIEKRKLGHGAFMDNGTIVVVTGDELKKLADDFIPKQEMNVAEIKGTVANKGKVTGRVRVMFTPNEMAAFQEGEILVAPETTPAYVPIMQKAAAFVTDQGGITSHAAIVSREMGKPCITGTKIASQVLKTGDVVEVDAERGVVTILK